MACKILVFCLGRSGSTNVSRAISALTNKLIIGEPFSKRHKPLIKDEEHLKIQLEHICNQNRVIGIKNNIRNMGYNEDKLHSLNKVLFDRFDGIFYLTRKNLLKVVVSEFISYTSRVWNYENPKVRNKILNTDFDEANLEMFSRNIRIRKGLIEYYDQYLSEYYSDKLFSITYEDIFDRSEDRVSEIMRGLDALNVFYKHEKANIVRAKNFLRDSLKVNRNDTYNLIPNIDEIDQKLGCSETGYLFDK